MSGFGRLMAAPVALGVLSAAAPPAAPIVTAGQIVSTTVDVTQPPPSPLVKLQVKGTATLVDFSWTGPSGEVFTQEFTSGTWEGASLFQGQNSSSTFGNAFNLYTEAGTWTLASFYLCGAGACSSYSGSALTSLFGRVTVQVTNPNKPDFEPPKAVAGVVDTPTVSLSTNRTVKIGVAATDNLSGIAQVSVCANTPATFFAICVTSPAASSVVLSKTYFMTDTLQTGTTTGTYTIDDVYLTDNAGNTTGISDAPTIKKLFNGRITIDVTN